MSLLSFFKNPEEKFWLWFKRNEDILYNFESDQENVFDKLSFQLAKINDNLTFEFGPILSNNKREFIISADGINAAFPAVEKLFLHAPNMDKWIIRKFRPRRNPINDLTIGDHNVKAEEVSFRLFNDENPNKVGIILFFKDYKNDEKEIWSQIGYLFLDETLGEYDVETKVGAIVFEGIDSKYYENIQPLFELPNEFDKYFDY